MTLIAAMSSWLACAQPESKASETYRIDIRGSAERNNVGFLIKNADGSERWNIASAYNENLLRIYPGAASASKGMVLSDDGKVGIGTTSLDAELTVRGRIHTEEIICDLQVPAPDYVFEEDYKLPTLQELENYIRLNKHLPEIPSAEQMAIKGLNVAEMNMALLKKVEEMTLYMIQLQKKNEALENSIIEMKVSVKKKYKPRLK